MELSFGFKFVLMFVMTLIFILGIVGNCAVIAVVARYKKMRTVTNIFITQLALADLLIVLLCMPFVVPQVFLVEKWNLGKTICQIITFIRTGSVYISIFTLTAMSLERYFALVYPIWSKVLWTKRHAFKISVLIVVISLLLALPKLFMQKMFRIPLQANISSNWIEVNTANSTNLMYREYCFDSIPSRFVSLYNYSRVTICYVGPLLTISVLYGMIARHLRASARIDNHVCRHSHRTRHRVVHMLMAMVIIFAICWLPVHVFFLVEALPHGIDILRVFYTRYRKLMAVRSLLVYVNCVSNPVLYTFMSPQYRAGFYSLLYRCSACCRPQQASSSLVQLSNLHAKSRSTIPPLSNSSL